MMPSTAVRLIVFFLVMIPAALLRGQSHDRIDPKNPDWINLPVLGIMHGKLNASSSNEKYGEGIYPVGDVDHSGTADWCVSRQRIDTIINNRPPLELLLYKGVKGGLPSVESGIRIGPTELAANTTFIASGDWDSDGNPDIAVTIQQIGDTTSGGQGWDVSRLVIFWGNVAGAYSLADTTRLENGYPIWLGPAEGRGEDRDGDGVDDLLTVGNDGLKQGQPMSGPFLAIFKGHHGQRWGRNGVPRIADWSWWTPPKFRRLASLDQNCDGAADLVFYYEEDYSNVVGSMSILYGNPRGGFPDTNNIQSPDIAAIGGQSALLDDITGDGVPDLLIPCLGEIIRIYVGEPGVKVIDQFGGGKQEPDPEHGRIYSKPWAEIWLPYKLDDAFPFTADLPLHALGDANLDGINDIWGNAQPWIIIYNTGYNTLDSLFDGLITMPGQDLSTIVNLGDITGTGLPVIALSGSDGFGDEVEFVTPSAKMPQTGEFRLPPHGEGIRCIGAASAESSTLLTETLDLRADPNPVVGEVKIHWNPASATGEVTLIVRDVLGREIAHWNASASNGNTKWVSRGVAGGMYFITLVDGDAQSSVRIKVVR